MKGLAAYDDDAGTGTASTEIGSTTFSSWFFFDILLLLRVVVYLTLLNAIRLEITEIVDRVGIDSKLAFVCIVRWRYPC